MPPDHGPEARAAGAWPALTRREKWGATLMRGLFGALMGKRVMMGWGSVASAGRIGMSSIAMGGVAIEFAGGSEVAMGVVGAIGAGAPAVGNGCVEAGWGELTGTGRGAEGLAAVLRGRGGEGRRPQRHARRVRIVAAWRRSTGSGVVSRMCSRTAADLVWSLWMVERARKPSRLVRRGVMAGSSRKAMSCRPLREKRALRAERSPLSSA